MVTIRGVCLTTLPAYSKTGERNALLIHKKTQERLHPYR